MKTSKLLAMLAFAGLCGTSETQARSHKFEIKHLERHRAERLEEHREAKERLDELNFGSSFTAAADAESSMRLSRFVTVDMDGNSSDTIETGSVSVLGNEKAEQEVAGSNWQVKDPQLIRERELEEARMRDAAREIAKLNREIRKQKARQRRI